MKSRSWERGFCDNKLKEGVKEKKKAVTSFVDNPKKK